MATRKRDKPPLIRVVVTPKGLRPETPMDAEEMVSLRLGNAFELVPASKRSLPQLRTYWKALGLAVKATDKWPDAERLHRDIKMTLGYREQSVNLYTGEISLVPDSIALDKMQQEEFQVFFNKAMELLGEAIGFDPLSFLSEAA